MRRLSLVAVLLSAGVAAAEKPAGPPVDPRPRGEIVPVAWQEFYQSDDLRYRPLAYVGPNFLVGPALPFIGAMIPR
jgi:hypothetical protein